MFRCRTSRLLGVEPRRYPCGALDGVSGTFLVQLITPVATARDLMGCAQVVATQISARSAECDLSQRWITLVATLIAWNRPRWVRYAVTTSRAKLFDSVCS